MYTTVREAVLVHMYFDNNTRGPYTQMTAAFEKKSYVLSTKMTEFKERITAWIISRQSFQIKIMH